MANSLFIASAEPFAGKSSIALGLLSEFSRTLRRVGVFRPIVRHRTKPDYVLQTLLRHGGVTTAYEDAAGVTYDEVHRDRDGALSRIVEQFHALQVDHDSVLVVGSDFTDVTHAIELEFNAQIAANLGTPMVLVVAGHDRSPRRIRDVVEASLNEVESNHAVVQAVMVNAAPGDRLEEIKDEVREGLAQHRTIRRRQGGHPPLVFVLPYDDLLAAPTMWDLTGAVDGTLISGDEAMLSLESYGVLVAAMTLPNVLDRIFDGATVVVPADRFDVILGVLMAHSAKTFPALSGLVLNGGLQLQPQIATLIDGMQSRLPFITTDVDTQQAVTALAEVRGRLTPDATRKVDRAVTLFREHVDPLALLDRLDVERSAVVTPLMFEYYLADTARAHRTTIVLPEGTEGRVLQAASTLLARNVADLILLGDPDEIQAAATQMGAAIDGAQLIDPGSDKELAEEFAHVYAGRRAHRGVTLDIARDRVRDGAYFGTLLVLTGRADGMVSGAAHPTAHTIRPAMELLRDTERVSTVSSVFFMCLQDRVLVYADCAIVPDPSYAQLADIAISSAGTAAAFGIEPRVAMLSYSTGTSGTGSDVEKVRAATAMVRERRPDIVIEGPLQYDAAVDPDVAATKLPGSDVAGKATVLIFPDLNTGNNTYKAVQRSAGAVAIGPVLQGLTRPVNDLSRGASVHDIVNTVALTAVQARRAAAANGRA